MLAAVIALLAISFAAELIGFGLIVLQAVQYRSMLRRWIEANPNCNEGGSYTQVLMLNGFMLELLGAPKRNAIAAALIGLGIVTGSVANFLSLTL